jgi:hypothetical protein
MKTTDEIMQCVQQALAENDRRTAKTLQKKVERRTGVKLSESTIRTILRNQNYKWRPRRPCNRLTEEQIRKRQQFVVDWNGRYFANVRGLPMVFTDESRFCEQPDSEWTWVRRGEFLMSIMAELEKYTHLSIMVWGAIGYNYKSRLIIITGNVNAQYYQNMLAEFFTHCDAAFGKGGWVLVQDGAPAHTAEGTIDHLCSKCKLMPSWPPNSPDMNPIEALWGAIKRQIDWTKITKIDEAIAAITKAWNELPQSKINDLVMSFANRVQMVHDAEGLTIQPLLSSHKKTIPEGYLADAPRVEPNLWTKDEDESLELLRAHKITDIIPHFPRHAKAEIKKRLRLIKIYERNEDWGQPVILDFGGMTDNRAQKVFSAEMEAFANEMLAHATAAMAEAQEIEAQETEAQEIEAQETEAQETEADAPADLSQTEIESHVTNFATYMNAFATDVHCYTEDLGNFAAHVSEFGKVLHAIAPQLGPIANKMTYRAQQTCGVAGALESCAKQMAYYATLMIGLASHMSSRPTNIREFGTEQGIFASQLGHVCADMGAFAPQLFVLSANLEGFVDELPPLAIEIGGLAPELRRLGHDIGALAAEVRTRASEMGEIAVSMNECVTLTWSTAAEMAGLDLPLFEANG